MRKPSPHVHLCRCAVSAAGAVALALVLAPAASATSTGTAVAAVAAQASPTDAPGARITVAIPARATTTGKKKSGGCGLLNTVDPLSSCNPLTSTVAGIGSTVASLPGTLAGAAASGVMDQVAQWMIDAASTVNAFVVRQEGQVLTPELQASWYQGEFGQLAALGAGLAGLVALIALASAALRRDVEGLGEVVFGVFRAGFGTGVVIAVTVMALGVADGISNAVASSMSHQFFTTLSSAWSASGFGGFQSAALAFLIALVQVLAALLVWIELLVRDAAIYVAVLFFPVVLAAGIWPAWVGGCGGWGCCF